MQAEIHDTKHRPGFPIVEERGYLPHPSIKFVKTINVLLLKQ